MDELLRSMDKRLERIEGKLDVQLEKTARHAEAIDSIRGHIRLIASIGLAALSAAFTAIMKYIIHGR